MPAENDPQVFTVDESGNGRRVDVWLAQAAGLSRASVHRRISSGSITIDGAVASKSDRVRPGQSVVVGASQPADVEVPDVPLEVRYEDEHLAVVAKPAGVVVHPSPGARGPSLVQTLAKRMELAPEGGPMRPGIVHRLDKGTSGLLVVAKSYEALVGLSNDMRRRAITRSYEALVLGHLRTASGRIEAPVGRSANPTLMAVVGGGRSAVTDFKVSERFSEATLTDVRLETGRTHQIRVHFAHIGHPVVGDTTYGPASAPLARRLGLTRPFLHAGLLRFLHPISGVPVEVTEPLPTDLATAVEMLRSGS